MIKTPAVTAATVMSAAASAAVAAAVITAVAFGRSLLLFISVCV